MSAGDDAPRARNRGGFLSGCALHAHRLGLMRRFMERRGYEALAFTNSDWIEWAGNHPVGELTWERPVLLLIPREGPSSAFFSEQSRDLIAAERRRRTLWIDDVFVYGECPGQSGAEGTIDLWPQMLQTHLRRSSLDRGVIGADARAPLASLAQMMPGLKLDACGAELRQLRWVKHADEIAMMRRAAALSDRAMGFYREELWPGRLVAEADYAVAARLAACAAEEAQDENFVIAGIFTLSGPVAASPKGDAALAGKRVLANEAAVSTIATRLNGLAMELSRTWLIGRASPEVQRMNACALQMQTAAIEAASARQPVSRIHQAAHAIADNYGLAGFFTLRCGHGIGVTQHDFPEDMPRNHRPLLEGETYAIEPGLYARGIGGFRFSDVVVVREQGGERITRAPYDAAFLQIG